MKKMKKIVAMALASAMVMGMTTTAFAASAGDDGKMGTADDTGVITVSGIAAEEGLEVLAHPIVKAEYEYSGSFSGYEAIYGGVTVDELTGDITVSDAQMTDLLSNKVNASKAIPMTKSGADYTATVPVGSYLVQISNAETAIYGNVVVSVKYDRDANGQTAIIDKNLNITEEYAAGQPKVQLLPTIDKAILENDDEVNGNTVAIGDTVNYQIKTTVPYYGGAYPVYNITDTLTGLSLNSEVVVTVDGDTLVEGTDYTIVEDEDNFTLDFVVNGAYKLNDYQGKDLYVTYSAEVDDDAALNNNANVNDATLNFTRDSKVEGNNDSDNDKTKSYTFDIDAVGEGEYTHAIITKYGQTSTTASAPLENAEFTLYKNEACTEKYENDVFDGVVRSDENGQLTMTGLDEGTYYLKETEAPEGYTLNNTVYKITITAEIGNDGELTSWEIKVFDTTIENSEGATSTFTITGAEKTVSVNKTETQIQNTKIASLPSTGGIGTALFTFGGCGIMIAAAFLLMANRRKDEA